MLPDKIIEEFKEIIKKEYGQDLTDTEAKEQGERLLMFFKTLIEIDQKVRAKRKV